MPPKLSTILWALALGCCPLTAPFAAANPVVAPAPAPPTGPYVRNLILFLGDGMGSSTVATVDALEAREKGPTGEAMPQSIEALPPSASAGASDTHLQALDSSAALSAVLSGVPPSEAAMGLGAIPPHGACAAAERHSTLFEQAKDAGLAVGLVTTARVTLPAPAAAYAHVADRDWEIDSRMPAAALAEGCRDIARQLVEFDHHGALDVVLGGGRLAFLPADETDPGSPQRRGVRVDGADLIALWQARHPTGRFVWTAAQLAALGDAGGPVLGLFAPDAMAAQPDGNADAPPPPSLGAMTRAAIARLALAPRGYVLVVAAGRAGAESTALADAVGAAVQATSARDTLILFVTAGPRTGEGVAVHAHGPGSHRLRGVIAPLALHRTLRAALDLPAAN